MFLYYLFIKLSEKLALMLLCIFSFIYYLHVCKECQCKSRSCKCI